MMDFSFKKCCSFLFIVIAVLLVYCNAVYSQETVSTDKNILIRHVNIINVKDGSIAKDKAILIKNNLVAATGTFAEPEAKSTNYDTIDAHGRYAIPGLWDMHVHMEGEDLVEDNKALLQVYVAYGITTVRDAASDLGLQVLAWRDEINQGKLFGPRIFTAGRKLEGINSIWKGDMEIGNEEDLKKKLDTLQMYKVDFVKITENTLPGDLFLTSVKEAKARGFKVSGHVPYDLSIHALADAGFSSIEHASYVLRLGSDEQEIVSEIRAGKLSKADAGKLYSNNFNQAKAIEGYRYLAKKNVAVCPTLIGGKQLAYLDVDDHQKDAYLQYLTKRFTSNYGWRIKRQAGDTKEQVEQRKKNYEQIAKQIPYLQSAGVLLLAGSDAAALNSFIYPALSLHQELTLYQKAGLQPLAILQSATLNGAKFMGVDDSLAAIAPGKIADIVLLNSNPLEDIAATQDIYAVIKNGNYLDRKALDSLLAQAKERRIQLDAERTQ